MDIYPQQILELAAKYIGYKEKAGNKDLYSFEGNAGSGNYTMFQAELDKAGFWNNAKQGYEWCTSFVAWCFWRMAGSEAKEILCLTGDYGASCTMWAGYYKSQSRLFAKPKVGDQYFQKGSDGKPCHTGLVEKVSDSGFTTIEGNAGNMVKRVNRKLDSGTVYGFGRPKYAAEKTKEPVKEPVKETAKTEDETMVRYKTVNDVPEWAKAETKELMELGLNGTGGDTLDVTDDMLRCMIVSLRMCKALVSAAPEADKDALFAEFKKNLKLTVEVE